MREANQQNKKGSFDPKALNLCVNSLCSGSEVADHRRRTLFWPQGGMGQCFEYARAGLASAGFFNQAYNRQAQGSTLLFDFFARQYCTAGMAKWQGNRFVSGRSGVRSPLPAFAFVEVLGLPLFRLLPKKVEDTGFRPKVIATRCDAGRGGGGSTTGKKKRKTGAHFSVGQRREPNF